ncbi:MAG: hydrolase [Leptospiraceae bacterium]|nr:MAG: hydrolase [Leptospiraceae bacterium]
MITHEIYFRIPRLLQNSFLQTTMASIKMGNNVKFIKEISKYELIKTKKGVRLLGAYTKSPNKFQSKGLVILLHGWEGSIDSSYIIRMGNFLIANGFDIFRLNFRDHGNTHHLNEGIFLGTLIEEVYDAIIQIMQKYNLPTYVVGFSLGGNFAIRFALLYNKRIRNNKKTKFKDILELIFAVSPAIDPKKSTMVIDQDLIYKKYFLQKWKESLKLKQFYFPYLYNFEPFLKIDSIMELTEKGILKFTNYKSIDEYFAKYTISNFSFKNLKVPIYILTSHDDPIIPVEDFQFLKKISNIHLCITEKGGHNGFIMDFQFHCYYMDLFADIIRTLNLTKFF